METITIKGDYYVQNRLKAVNRRLVFYYRINISKFKFLKFECTFNNPYDTSVTILKSDIDALKNFIESSVGELHELGIKIRQGQADKSDTYLHLSRWRRVAKRTLELFEQ